MARPDVWLSLEQLEYRADALSAASFYVRATANAADKAGKHSVTSAACWCAEKVIRETSGVFGVALQMAHEVGGAPISPEAITVFQVFHAIDAVRKEALASKAARAVHATERAAKEAAQAEVTSRKSAAPKRRRKAT